MNDKYICTVLLITYNQADSIAKAIESILAQKTKYPYKIHVFDDASTDGTTDIVLQYASKYPDKIIPYIAKQNQGSASNVWAAYGSVDTKYCAILEGDDYWCDDEKLELQISALEANPECSSCAGNTIMHNIGDKYENIKNGDLLIDKKLIEKSNKFDKELLSGRYSGYINHISTRLLNMKKINIAEIKHRETLCYDNAQFFYFLTKGPVYMCDRIFSTRIMTGKGVFSGKNVIERLRKHITVLMDTNIETEYEVEQLIYEHLADFINYFMHIFNKSTTNKNNKVITKFQCKLSLKRLKHYILPLFIIDILNLPRDIIRAIKKYHQKGD